MPCEPRAALLPALSGRPERFQLTSPSAVGSVPRGRDPALESGPASVQAAFSGWSARSPEAFLRRGSLPRVFLFARLNRVVAKLRMMPVIGLTYDHQRFQRAIKARVETAFDVNLWNIQELLADDIFKMLNAMNAQYEKQDIQVIVKEKQKSISVTVSYSRPHKSLFFASPKQFYARLTRVRHPIVRKELNTTPLWLPPMRVFRQKYYNLKCPSWSRCGRHGVRTVAKPCLW